VKFTADPGGVTAVAEYARTRSAGYVDAHHAGGCLRVWRDNVWIDRLAADPGFGQVEQGIANDIPVFHVRTDDLDAALSTWIGAVAGDRLMTFATGVPPTNLDLYLAAAGELIELRVSVDVAIAASLATERPTLEMTWSAADLHIDLPARTARIWRVVPVSAEQEAEIRARFDRCRAT
jgi:hypothetical protein